jgi:hypothetical protein
VRSGPGEARTILLLHVIGARPSKQPCMVRTFLKVYMELGSYFVPARTNRRHHHHHFSLSLSPSPPFSPLPPPSPSLPSLSPPHPFPLPSLSSPPPCLPPSPSLLPVSPLPLLPLPLPVSKWEKRTRWRKGGGREWGSEREKRRREEERGGKRGKGRKYSNQSSSKFFGISYGVARSLFKLCFCWEKHEFLGFQVCCDACSPAHTPPPILGGMTESESERQSKRTIDRER